MKVGRQVKKHFEASFDELSFDIMTHDIMPLKFYHVLVNRLDVLLMKRLSYKMN